MKKSFFLVILVLSVSWLQCQAYDYFSAFEGLPAANAKIQSMGLKSPKLIQIGSYSSILTTGLYNNNPDTNGRAYNWFYAYSYENDTRKTALSLTQSSGSFTTDIVGDWKWDSCPPYGIEFPYYTKEINTANLLDSYSVVAILDSILEHGNYGGHLLLSDLQLSRITLTWSDSTDYFFSHSEYSWEMLLHYSIDYGTGPQVEDIWFAISADSGKLLEWNMTADVKEEPNRENGIIYPNPAHDFITLNIQDANENENIEIFSVLGDKVLTGEFRERIDISGLQPGLYFVRYGKKTERFVKL
jgi:hypothetical protein